MVHLPAVRQLVHHHIVQHLRRAEHQQTVEIQVSLGGTAAPAGGLTADGDSPVVHAHLPGKVLHPGRDGGLCLPGQAFQILPGEGVLLCQLSLDAKLFLMGLNPPGFLPEKGGDVPLGHPHGSANQYAALRRDLQADGFSAASDNLYLFHKILRKTQFLSECQKRSAARPPESGCPRTGRFF